MKGKLSHLRPVALLICIFIILGAGQVSAQIRVISANPVSEAIIELAEAFELMTGYSVAVEVMGTNAINQLLVSSEPADILVGTLAIVDQAVIDNHASSPAIPVARVGIGIIIRDGAQAPDVSTVSALRQAALEADGVIFNTAGSGQSVDRMFEELGISEQITPKSARPANAAQTMDRMRAGQGLEIGFGLLSEIRPYEGNGIVLIGRLPEELQTWINYEGIVLHRSGSPAIATEFLQFLVSDAARETFAATGVD